MPKARVLDRRRKSIQGIRKITRTMELISTARFKRAMDRASAATAYTKRITELTRHLADAGLEVAHPLLETHPETHRAVLLVLSGNRGMCAGYNANILRLARNRLRELQKAVPQVDLEVSGKKAITAFQFRGMTPDKAYTHFEDRPDREETDALAARYIEDYTAGRLDRLDVVYTQFESLSRQQAVIETLLPLTDPTETHVRRIAESPYEFLPSIESILNDVIPTGFRVRLFKCFLDAAVSEQIARMVAMKSATENADSMIGHLSMAYNRARQGQITTELLEVISGAEALN
ncbi:MAG TPA: ATP synthase F1 subunit gamma [Planctomycetaceae bacterium]|nr:ATP synthase F1 subunit gamma [Planctomycetaceae bacterium]